MIKTQTALQVVKNERTYTLYCASDSPLGELHDVLMEMKGYCVERMISAQKEEQANADQQKLEVSE